jgi:nucleoside-diphosphate-sugar epimerase
MKILVTGAAGYIGSILVPRLLGQGQEVVALDSFLYKQTSLLDCCHNENLTVVNGDARDQSLVSGLLKGVDAIFPLACLTGAPLCAKDPIAAKSINFEAIKMLLKLRSKEQRIIFPTTNSGYGVGEKGKHCTEETPMRPVSLYGKLKVDIEKKLLDSENTMTFRFATVFGTSPRMRLDLLVNDFTYRAVNDRFLVLFEAHFKRNYLHVRDAAEAFVYGLEHFEQMKGEPYNVGLSDANISKIELCQEIQKYVPGFYFPEASIGEDVDKRDYIVSNAKIESQGFKPQNGLSAGIVELIKGFQIVKRNQYANV